MAQLILAQQTQPPTPPSESDAMYFDSADGIFKYVDDTGAVVIVGGNALELQGTPVSATAPTDGQVLVYSEADSQWEPGGGSSGGVASLSGAGVTESPGILNQAGGMAIVDEEGDAFSVLTNANINLISNSDEGYITINASGTGGVNIGTGNDTIAIVGEFLTYFAGGTGALKLLSPGDTLSFWYATGAAQQTVTGALSTVTDASAKDVLTSILAALSATAGYGLVVDGTT